MTHEEQIISAIKKTLPAVVSIMIGKEAGAVQRSIPEAVWQEIESSAREENEDVDRKEIVSHMPKTESGKVRVGYGSGFIISSDGLILTNKHVVIDADAEYTITTAAEDRYTAKVLARDPLNDVAILKIEENNLPTAELGDSGKILLGQSVIALGNALGEFKNSASAGIISGLSRFITAFSDGDGAPEHLRGLIQTDAAINPGNSGGPLVNLTGEVIGINSAMVFGASNIGFAIPVNKAKKDLADIKKFGYLKKPYLGVRYIPISQGLKEKLKLPVEKGVLVRGEELPGRPAIMRGSPADKAGVREGDIVLEVNGKELSETNVLEDILENAKIGDEIKLKILRDAKEIEISVILEERK
ncbi:MAG: trypsin-like peptidase domain-containing protein [Candidatus Sungbacteria bacterium]|nr:trypsin-like peptidase domain-containing protein [Candidatus Sungbacteria bacterium]